MAKDATGILLIGGLGVLVYGYMNHWFDSLLGVSSTAAAPAGGGSSQGLTAAQLAAQQQAASAAAAQLAAQQQAAAAAAALAAAQARAAAAAAAGNPPPAPPTPPGTTTPAPGATITTLPQALAQIAAHDAYIIPSLDLYVLLQTAIPPNSGYNFYVDSNGVPLLLRDDLNALVPAVPAGQAGTMALADIKSLATTAGLSGLGDFARHMHTRTGRRLMYRA